MRSPALAIAWEFRRRHRWGLYALSGYLIILGTIKILNIITGQTINLDSPERFAAVVVVPLAATFIYLLAVFSFGLAGDLAARESIYPARLFALPVSTAALAGWPMLYGTLAMVLLWIASRLSISWPSELDVPLIWPAPLAAALLAWTQALTWMPHGLPGLRVIVAVLWLAAIDSVVLLALRYQVREGVMVAFLLPQLPLAYLAARAGIARARRGDVPDWRGMFARLGQIWEIGSRRRGNFPSPARAQSWFEWRRHGRSLPALVGILLPFELALLFAASHETPALVFFTLLGVLFTPPFMASFAAATVSKPNPHLRDAHGLQPFDATRPLTSAALIAARLKMTIWSTLAAWLLVLVAIPIALTLSGHWPVVIERASQLVKAFGAPRAIVLALLGLAGLVASTWKQLVQNLCIGLTGREWLIKASVFIALSFLSIIGPLLHWLSGNRAALAALWAALPYIVALLVCLKVAAAAWIATRLHSSRLLGDRALLTGAVCWVVAVLALHALLVCFFSAPHLPGYFLALVAILGIPLVRLSATPLALTWNRHR